MPLTADTRLLRIRTVLSRLGWTVTNTEIADDRIEIVAEHVPTSRSPVAAQTAVLIITEHLRGLAWNVTHTDTDRIPVQIRARTHHPTPPPEPEPSPNA